MGSRVRKVVRTAEHVTDTVMHTHGSSGRRHAAEPGAAQGVGARGRIGGSADHAWQRVGQDPDALRRDHGDDRGHPGGVGGLHQVGQRVHAARRGQRGGQSDREVGVVHHAHGLDRPVATGLLVAIARDAPHRRHLAARVGGGHGQDRDLGPQRDRLRQAGGRATAHADQQVGSGALGHRHGLPDQVVRHVGDGAVEAGRGPPRERAGHDVDVARAAPVADHQDPLAAEPFRLIGYAGQAAGREDDATAGLFVLEVGRHRVRHRAPPARPRRPATPVRARTTPRARGRSTAACPA